MERKKNLRRVVVENIREIVFGLEDSLVSTLGALTGIAAGAQNAPLVILSGLVLIAVEAVSMSAGSYLSSKSATQAEVALEKDEKRLASRTSSSPLRAALVMFVFYFAGGFVPLFPYFFLPIHVAYLPSIVATAVVLFLIGVWSAKYTKRSAWKSGMEMVVVSLGAAALGYAIGRIVSGYLPIPVL